MKSSPGSNGCNDIQPVLNEGLISRWMRTYGLKRCNWKGWDAFRRYIGLRVVTFKPAKKQGFLYAQLRGDTGKGAAWTGCRLLNVLFDCP
ncbi:MAG: hypothetical protein CSA22_06895 [Deltaproteobacteria bacterium]|nr:MAG: hypothetical protein CSA22_06895 [Deltaproteobacteria bacterium]